MTSANHLQEALKSFVKEIHWDPHQSSHVENDDEQAVPDGLKLQENKLGSRQNKLSSSTSPRRMIFK